MVVGLLLVACTLLVSSGGPSPVDADPEGHGYYQRLAGAFLKGQLSLEELPPEKLINAKNPFDPTFNGFVESRYGIHDAIFKDDRYFYYWGPAPVALLVAPARFAGLELTERDLGIFAACALVVLACLFLALVHRRWSFGRSTLAALVLMLGAQFSAFFLLRRVAIWESTALVAAAMGMGALVCWIAAYLAGRDGRRAGRLWLTGGLLFAASIATRLDYIVFGLFPMLLLLTSSRDRGRSAGNRVLITAAAAALVPALLALALLLLYNYQRFGSPVDFGLGRLLSGIDETQIQRTSPSYVLPNLYYYVARPISFIGAFPFLEFNRFVYPLGTPRNYRVVEPVAGMFFTSPLLVTGVLSGGIVVIARRLKDRFVSDARIPLMAAAAVTGVLQLLVLSASTFSASQRYRLEADIPLGLASVFAISLASEALRGHVRRVFTGLIVVGGVGAFLLALFGAYRGYFPTLESGNWLEQRLREVSTPISDLALRDHPVIRLESELNNNGVPIFPLAANRVVLSSSRDCRVRMDLTVLRTQPPPGTSAYTVTALEPSSWQALAPDSVSMDWEDDRGRSGAFQRRGQKFEAVVRVQPGDNTFVLHANRSDGVSPTWFQSAGVRYQC